MTTLKSHREICPATGPATGKLTGVNHLQLVVHDMTAAIWFYRDVLGLTLVATRGKADLDAVCVTPVQKNYFFRLGNGDMLSLIEVPTAPPPQRSMWDIWPEGIEGRVNVQKMDHLAINVETIEELGWFVGHLRSHGVKVTDLRDVRPGFVHSIYFTDPSGNALEIATFDWENAALNWDKHEPSDWYTDPEPPMNALQPDVEAGSELPF